MNPKSEGNPKNENAESETGPREVVIFGIIHSDFIRIADFGFGERGGTEMVAPKTRKKYFTAAEANGALPLVRAIVRDITELAAQLRERHERLNRLRPGDRFSLSDAHDEELLQVQAEFERGQEKMEEYVRELSALSVELKDPFTGLIDFPSLMNGRPVYLCWRLGEPEVAHWHELEAGFAGRQRLVPDASRV
jgi:hypothetical protein